MTRTGRVLVVAIGLMIGACGGGGDEAGDLGDDVFGDVGESSGDVEPGDQDSGGATEIGPVTQTADPGTGWVEVDGERYEFEAFGATHYRCELLDDRITVNFQQTTSGHDLTLQGSLLNGQWNASLTFVPAGETQVNYGATIGFDPGRFGIDEEAVSYEGTVARVEDFDVQNAQEMQAVIAINCASPGGAPSAEIGGEPFTFPLSGASSLECVVSDEAVGVLISHSQPEFRQLQIDIEDNGGELFGAAHVTTSDGTFTSFVPPDGTGLEIDGASLSYEGTFTSPSGEEVEGTVSVTCG
jgi:hypothetical protein